MTREIETHQLRHCNRIDSIDRVVVVVVLNRAMPILGFYSIVVPGIVLVASIVIIVAVLCCVKQPVDKNNSSSPSSSAATATPAANNNRRVIQPDDPTLMVSNSSSAPVRAFTIDIDDQPPPAFDLPPSYDEAITTTLS